MAQPSIVAVYGIPAGERRPVRLGTGSLEHERIVVLDEDLWRQLASDDPPVLKRVGIAGRLDGEPLVEVLEVRQTLRSENTDQWAVELASPAACPTIWEVRTENAGQPVGPGNGICFFFQRASFC